MKQIISCIYSLREELTELKFILYEVQNKVCLNHRQGVELFTRIKIFNLIRVALNSKRDIKSPIASAFINLPFKNENDAFSAARMIKNHEAIEVIRSKSFNKTSKKYYIYVKIKKHIEKGQVIKIRILF